MSMNPLFWSILVILLVAMALTAAIRRRAAPTNIREARDRLEKSLVDANTSDDTLWKLRNIEFLATGDRLHAVVTLAATIEDRRLSEKMLKSVAAGVYESSPADVVFIEAQRRGTAPALYLFAPDGKGWWGQETITTASEALPS